MKEFVKRTDSKNYVGGRWIDYAKQTLEVTNPCYNTLVGRVPNLPCDGILQCVESSHSGFLAWSSRSVRDRQKHLYDLAHLVEGDLEFLSRIITVESGKPIKESRREVTIAAGFIRRAAELATQLEGRMIPSPQMNKRCMVGYKPLGVSLAITPWNFPLALVARKLGPCLAVGCTMILKPAEQTPFTSLRLAELAEKAGLTNGELCVITGDADRVVSTAVSSSLVRKITFTGSTEVGRTLVRLSAEHLASLSLELGGHAPFIVFDDADLDLAVQQAVAIKFRNSGQTCVSANRFFVQDSRYDMFVNGMTEATKKLRIGDGLDESTDIGPLIGPEAVEKVLKHTKDAVEKGARILVGGKSLVPREDFSSNFFEPTVLVDWNTEMLLAKEETFGPIAPIMRFREDEEGIALANHTDYGLAAYVFTKSTGRAFAAMDKLNFGIIGINDVATASPDVPMGGFKQSGYGREGGLDALLEYVGTSYVDWVS